MKLTEFKAALEEHAGDALAFILPGGDAIPAHAHVTEVGRTEKNFVDCGGKLRNVAFCSLQVWVADDLEHRLPAGKLLAILDHASKVIGSDDLEMQIECQQGSISLFSIECMESREGVIVFALAAKQTACLAMETCLPEAAEEDSCCGAGTKCC